MRLAFLVLGFVAGMAPACGQGIIRTFAGGSVGDGGPATEAWLYSPDRLAFGPDGSLYVSDMYNHRVRRVWPDGRIETFAGTGIGGFSGDGGMATEARLYLPCGMAFAPDGSLYIADLGNRRVRQVTPDGRIRTVAGKAWVNGTPQFAGDGGPALQAQLNGPMDVAVGRDGSLYIADTGNYRVRQVGPDGRIRTVAGTGMYGLGEDGVMATEAYVYYPYGLATAPDGALYIAEYGNHRIRRLDPDGRIQTVAGSGRMGFAGDGGPAVEARVSSPNSIALGPDGSLYIADTDNRRIRRVDPEGQIATVVGGGDETGFVDGEMAAGAHLSSVHGVAVAPDGSLYITDTGNRRICRMGPDGWLATFAGAVDAQFNADGRAATQVRLARPLGVFAGSDGAVYIADTDNHRIRQVGVDGGVRTVAGSGLYPRGIPAGPSAREAILWEPGSVALGPDGRVYFADTNNHRVLRADFEGVLERVAPEAQFIYPSGLAFAPDGSLYIVEWSTHRIRQIGTDGEVRTVAGTGQSGFGGDGGAAVEARLNTPGGLAVGPDGSLYIADAVNQRIRRVDPNGQISTVAGTGDQGFSGDGGPATEAKLNAPSGVAVAPDGTLYIADAGNHRVRQVRPDGRIATVAGTGESGFSGDGKPAAQAQLNGPRGVAVGPDGALYIADSLNDRIRVAATR